MELKVIASGSSGNCYLLTENGKTLILDVGIPFKRIKLALGYDLTQVDGVLCSHEHFDHAQAVKDIIRAGIPIYLSDGTARALTGSQPHCAADLGPSGNILMGDWTIRPFSVEHDALDPVGFIIVYKYVPEAPRTVYITDTGYTKYLPFRPTNLIIECSYCEDILERNQFNMGERYLRMKMHHFGLNRVKTFLELLDRRELKTIVLVHLSATNSDVPRMIREVQDVTGRIPAVFVARPGDIIDLSGGTYEHE